MPGEHVINRVRKIHRGERSKSAAARPGTHTIRVPLGSNNVKYNTWFYGGEVNGDAFKWCAVYQSWVAAAAEIPTSIVPKNASVIGMRDFFQARGRIFQTPAVGDFVIFITSETQRHIGFVEMLLSDGRFTTIEGNVSDRVMRVTHSPSESNIFGYARPEYHKVEGREFDEVATKAEIKEAIRDVVSEVVSEEITKARKMLTDGGDGGGNVDKEKNNLNNIRELINESKDEIISKMDQ
jgi:CHAP domain